MTGLRGAGIQGVLFMEVKYDQKVCLQRHCLTHSDAALKGPLHKEEA